MNKPFERLIQPRIEMLEEKKLVGISFRMSLVQNRTGELWKNFLPRRQEITNPLSSDLYSLQVYDSMYFKNFNPTSEFTKYALLEVSTFERLPAGMEAFTLSGGQYAVFDYKGSSNDPSIFQYIYSNWLPASRYILDERPHFEVLGARYKNADENSEEEIWIPVRPRE